MSATKPIDSFEMDVSDDLSKDAAQGAAPSWFSRTYEGQSSQDMAARYRSEAGSVFAPPPSVASQEAAYETYRRRLDERFAQAQSMADPRHGLPDAAAPANQDFPSRPYYAGSAPAFPSARVAPSRKQKGQRPMALAIMTLSACSIGGLAGYVAANPGSVKDWAVQGSTLVAGFFASSPAPENMTVIGKKQIATAQLDVRDMAGAINTPIPLDITGRPADPNSPLAFRISGLPAEAYITKGMEVTEGEWILKAEDIRSAELVVPHTDVPKLDLEVAALEATTGLPAAPSQNMQVKLDTSAVPVPGVPQQSVKPEAVVLEARVEEPVIEPATALPDQGFNKSNLPAAQDVPKPMESLNPEAQNLMVKGQMLLGNGDVLAARPFFMKAFGMDTPTAAFGVGQTYDPTVYKRFNIAGLQGSAEAQEALARLPVQ